MSEIPIKIKEGVPPKHWCQAKLPGRERAGAVWQCTCGKFYRYGDHSDLYGDRDGEPVTPAKHEYGNYVWVGSSWRECDRAGQPLYRAKIGTKKVGWFRKEDIYEMRYSDE